MLFCYIYVTKAIYTLLVHFCLENDLRSLSGKFLCVIICQPENFEILCLCEGLPLSILILIKFYINFFVNERKEEGVAYLSFCSRRRIVNTPFTICASSLPVVVFSSVNIQPYIQSTQYKLYINAVTALYCSGPFSQN